MLGLRTAIEQACRQRACGLLVAVLVAAVMWFGAVHDAEHTLQNAGLACVAVGVVCGVLVVRRLARPPSTPPIATAAPQRLHGLSPPARRPFVLRTTPVPLRL